MANGEPTGERARLRAVVISLAVSVVLLAAKYEAYRLTGSTAILSDALESIVNVVAAVFGLGGIIFAGRPADRNHPYGHGKIEFFSAAFEGGLIAFAAVLIVYEVVLALLHGVEVRALDVGVSIVLGAGLVNLLLGWYLIRTGRKHASLTLVADGRHVLADFYTSAGIVIGLLLVRFTGIGWLDPVVAGVVALNLLWTGFRLVRHAAGGLLDEEDTDLLGRLLQVLQPHLGQGVIRVHHLRAIRAGRFTPRRRPPGGSQSSGRWSARTRARGSGRAGDEGERGGRDDAPPIPAIASTAGCAISTTARSAARAFAGCPTLTWRKRKPDMPAGDHERRCAGTGARPRGGNSFWRYLGWR
jgi:cation diffusion facilitator family transporter